MTTWILSIVRNTQPDATGVELGQLLDDGLELPSDVWAWLESHGVGAAGDDLTWVLVTRSDEHPGELSDLVAQREVDLDAAGWSEAYAAAYDAYVGSREEATD